MVIHLVQQSAAAVGEALTWTAFLNIANTALIVLAGFLAREAWKNIHARVDAMEERHGDIRERVASLEAAAGEPRRRRAGDRSSGPFNRE